MCVWIFKEEAFTAALKEQRNVVWVIAMRVLPF